MEDNEDWDDFAAHSVVSEGASSDRQSWGAAAATPILSDDGSSASHDSWEVHGATVEEDAPRRSEAQVDYVEELPVVGRRCRKQGRPSRVDRILAEQMPAATPAVLDVVAVVGHQSEPQAPEALPRLDMSVHDQNRLRRPAEFGAVSAFHECTQQLFDRAGQS